MKQNTETIAKQNDGCTLTCQGCTSCSAVNFEESRSIKSAGRNDSMQLYSAEALSYYFYFLPTLNRALGGSI
jgi:hypothetical protein